MIRPLLDLDFETVYDTKSNFCLQNRQRPKALSMMEYIKDSRFHAFGFSYKWVGSGQSARWVSGKDARGMLDSVDWAHTHILGQNVKFDGAILAWQYGLKPRSYVDTVAMSRSLLARQIKGHSLAALAEYFGFPAKGMLKTDGLRELTSEQEAELAEYCNHDVDLCEGVLLKLEPDFPESQYAAMDWTIRCFIEPKLRLDPETLTKAYQQERDRRVKIFQVIGLPKPVFASNDKFASLLRERGFEVPMKRSPRTGKQIPAFSLSDGGFLNMLESDNEELADLCEARVAAKSTTLETRSASLLALTKFDGFPFDIHFSGAHTLRSSGGSGAGGNPQNFKKGSGLTEAIVPMPGWVILCGDYAQIELRAQAWIAGELKLMHALASGGDPYCDFAAKVYSRPITRTDKLERAFGKESVLGLGYGMGAKKFILRVRVKLGKVISQEESEATVYLYRGYFSRIKQEWDALDDFLPRMAAGNAVSVPGAMFLRGAKNKIILPSGLALHYPNLRFDSVLENWVFDDAASKAKAERNGDIYKPHKIYGAHLFENICQAMAGEIKKVAIARAIEAGLSCVGEVHDEIIAVVPEDQARLGAEALKRAMELPMPWWSQLKLKADIGAGRNWMEAKA